TVPGNRRQRLARGREAAPHAAVGVDVDQGRAGRAAVDLRQPFAQLARGRGLEGTLRAVLEPADAAAAEAAVAVEHQHRPRGPFDAFAVHGTSTVATGRKRRSNRSTNSRSSTAMSGFGFSLLVLPANTTSTEPSAPIISRVS